MKLAFLLDCFKIGFKPMDVVLSLWLKVALEKEEDAGSFGFSATNGFSWAVSEIFLEM